jgi:hypothetical protein
MDISNPALPKPVATFDCPGTQADVSIWKDLVFQSVDTPLVSSACDAANAPATQYAAGEGWEGIRVVSIANPKEPKQIAAVDTDCGSHTHTLVPDAANDRLLIYVLSYPLGGQGVECNVTTHRKISVIEVPLNDPAAAKVVSTPSVGNVIGCHDVTVFTEKKIAAAACITETQMWDISDPVNPRIVASIRNPQINIHHSTTFSWDAQTIVIGDELGGALATPGCLSQGHAPLGALWFYDVSNIASPQMRGYYQTQELDASLFCTAHNFNVVPLASDRDVLVTSWYNGGTILLDFTDPAAPTRLGFYIPSVDEGRVAAWSSYWYNGHIFSNNFDEDVNSVSAKSRGMDVYRYKGPEAAAALRLPYLNPQTQEPLATLRDGAGPADVKGRTQRRPLPATGLPVTSGAALGIVIAAGLGAAFIRTKRLV